MIKQIQKIVLLAGLAGLVVGLAGCASVAITSIITTPVQSLPRPSQTPMKTACGSYYAWVNFNNSNAGYHVNDGANYITVYANNTAVPAGKYFVADWDIALPPAPTSATTNCISANDANEMFFTGVAKDINFFTVCFKDTSYGSGTKVFMVIRPTP